jgi:hypothetical protein
VSENDFPATPEHQHTPPARSLVGGADRARTDPVKFESFAALPTSRAARPLS